MKKGIITLILSLSLVTFSNDGTKKISKEKSKFDSTFTQEDPLILSGKVAAIFNYNATNIYNIYGKPDYVTTIKLNADEKVNFIGGGDTDNWLLEQSEGGQFGETYVHIRPVDPDLKTNIIIVTTKRIYSLNLSSTADMYNALVTFTYSDEPNSISKYKISEEIKEERTVEKEKKEESQRPEIMNSNYRFERNKKISPSRIYDDRKFTFIDFNSDIKNYEFPLFYIKDGKNEILTNFEIKNNTMIVERLFDRGVLKLGKEKVNIYNLKKR